ncbi:MAG: hypothetical protein LBC45_02730 [Chlamydiales bacterium]|nr:hypothetical protein [Chlamydiales bacterium]
MSTNINTRILELVGSAWKEVKKRVSVPCTCFTKSDLVNRVFLAAIRQGTLNCYTATKKSMLWLVQKISAGSGYLYNVVASKVASIWESIVKPSEFEVSLADDPERLSFFPRYKEQSYFSFLNEE